MKGNNPFAGAQLVLKNGDPVEELRFGKGRERALSSSTGEFNASSTKDLTAAITALMASVQNKDIVPMHQSAKGFKTQKFFCI